jgi:hypothetical protein
LGTTHVPFILKRFNEAMKRISVVLHCVATAHEAIAAIPSAATIATATTSCEGAQVVSRHD